MCVCVCVCDFLAVASVLYSPQHLALKQLLAVRQDDLFKARIPRQVLHVFEADTRQSATGASALHNRVHPAAKVTFSRATANPPPTTNLQG